MEDTKMKNRFRFGLALTALLAIPGLAFAFGHDGPGGDPAERAAKRAEHHAAMLAKYDTDKDGKLSDAELAKAREDHLNEMFQRLDANKDGVVTLDEFKANAPMHHFRHGPPPSDAPDSDSK